MIFTVTGKIGGGKTYWCVNYLVEKYLVYKEDVFQYVPRTELRIVTNIRDLYLPHTDLNQEIQTHGISKVFHPDFVKQNFNTIFIIDEAQILFHRKYYDKDVFAFFQTSRHYGVDIILITQDTDSLCKEIKILSEYEIEATSRSQRTKNVFIYKYKSGEDVAKRQIIKFNKKIAMLYRSRFKEEKETAPMVWKRYALIACIFVVVVIIGFKFMLSIWEPSKANAKAPKSILMTKEEIASVTAPELDSHDPVDNSEEISEYFQKDEGNKIIIMENGRVSGVVINDNESGRSVEGYCNLAKLACVGTIPARLLEYCNSCYKGIKQEETSERLAAVNESTTTGGSVYKRNPSPQKTGGEGFKVFDSLKGAE